MENKSKFEKNKYITDSSESSESEVEISVETPDASLSPSRDESIIINTSTSEESVIDDSVSNITKYPVDSPEKSVVEESTIDDSSDSEESNASFNRSNGSGDSEVLCVLSSSHEISNEQSASVISSSTTDSKSHMNMSVQGNSRRNSDIVYDVEDSPEKSRDIEDSLKAYESNGRCSRGSFNSNAADEDSEISVKSKRSGASERSVLERQIADKAVAYQNIMRAIRGCDKRKLKDGGKLLEEKMVRCKEELDELSEKLKTLPIEDRHSPKITKNASENSIFSIKDQNTANLGKIGIQTHRVQAALTVDALVQIHESLTTCPSENTFEDDPAGLTVQLMPHQKYALAWLLWRERQTPSGGILADDMGLGKTLSIISLILRSEEYKIETEEQQGNVQMVDGFRTYKGKTLVVCPASLLGHWEEQVKNHCKPYVLRTVIHHGKTREYQAKKLSSYDVVITTYGLMVEENKCDASGKKGIMFRVRWDRIVLDEAHVIRNPKTQKAIAACGLIGTYRWCLTGTPVQNRELDMYSLLRFIRCEPFDDRLVWKRWVDNKSASGIQRLKVVIRSILLRRTKEDLKKIGELNELPNKNIVPIYVQLDEEELKVYHEVLIFSKSLLAEYLRQKELNSNPDAENMDKIRTHLRGVEEIKTTEIFVLLLRLRQICCLPGLIHSFLEKETCIANGIECENPDVEDLYTKMSRMSISTPKSLPETYDKEKTKNVLLKSNPVFKMERPSAKIRAVLKVVEDLMDTDDKIVIVSQWPNLLKNLKPHFSHLNTGIATLDGTVPVPLRSKIINDFNRPDSDIRIMLLSLNVGGVGLNLIGGNRLVIFEPHWNPQLESQACDRVYRVGQRKEVHIYKVICKQTIEERIESLQKQKLELAATILQTSGRSGESQARHLTLRDLATLFDV